MHHIVLAPLVISFLSSYYTTILINNQIAQDHPAAPTNNRDSVNKSGCGSFNPFTNLITQANANGIVKNVNAISLIFYCYTF